MSCIYECDTIVSKSIIAQGFKGDTIILHYCRLQIHHSDPHCHLQTRSPCDLLSPSVMDHYPPQTANNPYNKHPLPPPLMTNQPSLSWSRDQEEITYPGDWKSGSLEKDHAYQ